MLVPKASVHEDGLTSANHRYIWTTGKILTM